MPDFTDKLEPAQPNGSKLLDEERRQSDIPEDELARHLLSRNDFLVRQARVLPVLEADPLFKKRKQFYLSRPDRFRLGLARAKQLRRYADQYGWDDEDQSMARYLCDDVSPYVVHYAMFITTVCEQGSAEQKAYWLPKIETMEVIGCYAQTELGHGSNVRGLECEARWDPLTREFILHSPTLTASKWWNGTMGRTANHAAVIAQLMLPDRNNGNAYINHGPHAFVIRIRDQKTHRPLKGIVVGDIGPKVGYATMDNGYLLFEHHRIPHSAMLSNYSRVDINTGTYTKPANAAVVYGSLTHVRANIVMQARLAIARAVTIAVRYTCVRRQFAHRDDRGDSAEKEVPVLDYPTVQIRLLPLLATAFAFHYTGEAMHQLYDRTRAEISDGDFSRLAELHAQSSGLKSLCTEIAANAIETCRRACGGHGFMASSGFVQLGNDYLSKPTVEGDNWMITQQTASYLLKRMEAASKAVDSVTPAKPLDAIESDMRRYLTERTALRSSDLDLFTSDEDIVEAFRRRSRDTSYRAHVLRTVHKRSWTSLLVPLRRVSIAESESILVQNFYAAVNSSSSSPLSPNLRAHLTMLFRLSALHTLDASAREFARAAAATEDQLDVLPDAVHKLMAQVRPHAVRLVDSWKIPDFLLDSALGRYDGRVYEDLFDRAHRHNPLNEVDFNSDYHSDELVRGIGDRGNEVKRLLAML